MLEDPAKTCDIVEEYPEDRFSKVAWFLLVAVIVLGDLAIISFGIWVSVR